ncbi:MAG: glucose-6-phosphate isomerase [Hydrogenimonas sp.]|nr:glucose-6-phosphate isomerase [Hydrogenimonas sp.]
MITYDLNIGWQADDEASMMMQDAFEQLVYERENAIAGYYNLPKSSKPIITEAKAFAASNDAVNNSDTIVVVGIGGSSLGIKAVDSMLRHKYPAAKRLIFLENPDPVDLQMKFSMIEKERSIFIVISKSGTTVETMSIFKAVLARFEIDLNKSDKDRIIAITDEGSALCRFVDTHSLKAYTIPHNVGGRFSVLSSVGIVPLTLAGYDTCSLLEGGASMVDRFFDAKEEHMLIKAAFIASNWREYRTNVLFAYGNSLEDFTKWYVQLWGESLGKIDRCGNRVGPTPAGHIGSVDQHSFLQLLMQGPKDKSVTFLKVEDFESSLKIPDIELKHIERVDYLNGHTFNELINAECDATMEALSKEEVPVDMIKLDKIDEENIGELILYYELLTSLVGSMLHVDTYNQPGVEMGKRILAEKFKKV